MSSERFSDPSLRQSLVREAERIGVEPALRSSVEALFASAEAPAPLPIYRSRIVMLAAAVVVAGLAIGFAFFRSHDEGEYTIAEARLWPAMASFYRQGVSPSTLPTMPTDGGPTLSDPRYQLLAVRSDHIDTVPCIVSDYRRDDGATLSVITTRASNLLREPDEDPDERYDTASGDVRIVGHIKNDYWICVAAPKSSPADLFDDALAHVVPSSK